MSTVIYSESEHGEQVKDAIERSPFAQQFKAVLDKVMAKSNRHEQVLVSWWYAPFVYIDVKDTRWNHYPCGHRFLVSFDLTNGEVSSTKSANRYVFAREGWGSFADTLTGQRVARYSDCGNHAKHETC